MEWEDEEWGVEDVKGVRGRPRPGLRTRLPLKNWKKNKEELVTLLTEESLMVCWSTWGSVRHVLAIRTVVSAEDAKR